MQRMWEVGEQRVGCVEVAVVEDGVDRAEEHDGGDDGEGCYSNVGHRRGQKCRERINNTCATDKHVGGHVYVIQRCRNRARSAYYPGWQ